jgi:hypothetical protein
VYQSDDATDFRLLKASAYTPPGNRRVRHRVEPHRPVHHPQDRKLGGLGQLPGGPGAGPTGQRRLASVLRRLRRRHLLLQRQLSSRTTTPATTCATTATDSGWTARTERTCSGRTVRSCRWLPGAERALGGAANADCGTEVGPRRVHPRRGSRLSGAGIAAPPSPYPNCFLKKIFLIQGTLMITVSCSAVFTSPGARHQRQSPPPSVRGRRHAQHDRGPAGRPVPHRSRDRDRRRAERAHGRGPPHQRLAHPRVPAAHR